MPRTVHRGIVLAVVCTAVFAVNVDVTIVNVALPSLVGQLGASTRELQWIVDAYTLTFAALVLAAGSLTDRFGRRGALLVGLGVYGAGNLASALAGTAGGLIATRALTGVGAAVVFPATLSILSTVFTDPAGRAKAFGIWGATTGLSVAAGPVAGGALLEHFWWGSVFAAKVPLVLAVVALTAVFVPTSKDPTAPRLDLAGLALSAAGLGVLVHALIEASARGWVAPSTIAEAALALALLAAFVGRERRAARPMLDLEVFADRRFTVAAVAVALSFFALAGFIFLITQYFQFVRGYGPLETGVRILPVATAIAVASVLGMRLTGRIGTTAVVATGLASLGLAFGWISTASAATGYPEIAAQMVLLGAGMGLTSAPATESIMGSVSAARAGVGSAVNDATRELGGTLGVAVIGSVFAWLYARPLAGQPAAAADSVGAAYSVADGLAARGDGAAAGALRAAASSGFFSGLSAGCLVAAGVCLLGAALTARLLPARAPLPVPVVVARTT